jgi:hypothetical protein
MGLLYLYFYHNSCLLKSYTIYITDDPKYCVKYR